MVLRPLALIPAALVALGVDTPALAQEAGPTAEGLETIVVTARRKQESAQSVPIAISAFSGEMLDDRGATRLADIAASVPGLFTAPGSNKGSNSPAFAIRGQLNRDTTPTADPSIGIYFADVPWSRPQGTNAGLIDIESIEVLKGPQGTLFGRNSTGGAILITPKAPTDEFDGYGKLTAGDYDLFGVEGVLNVPMGETLAMRVAAEQTQRDGYLKAVNSGQVMNDLDNRTVRVSLKWSPSDNFTSTLIVNWFESDTNGDGQKLIGVVPVALPGAGILRPAFLAALNAPIGEYEYLTSWAPGVRSVIPAFASVEDFSTRQHAKAETLSFQNTSELALGSLGILGDVTLKNIIAHRSEEDSITFETAAAPVLNVKVLLAEQDIEQFSEEFQLLGKNGHLDYIAGLFYFRESGFDRNDSFQLTPILVVGDGDAKNVSYSAFTHFSYDLSEAVLSGLTVTAGYRYTNDDRYFTNRGRRQTGLNAASFTCSIAGNLVPANDRRLCGTQRKETFREPTFDVGLNYAITPSALVYTSFSHGYRSGGFNSGATNAATDQPFLPESVDNYELGLKSDYVFGNVQSRLNLAAFYTEYKDIQRTVSRLVNNNLANLTINAARASIRGIEGELTIKPFADLTATLSYSYLDPKYQSFEDQFRDPVNGGIFPVDVSDSRFLLVSKNSFSASLNYAFPVNEKWGVPSVTASYYERSNFYTTSDINSANCTPTGDPNPNAFYVNCYNHAGKVPGYGLLNARADWKNMLGLGADVGVFVNNVTDKYYYPNALNALSTIGSLSAQIGAPRMYGVEVRVPFGASSHR